MMQEVKNHNTGPEVNNPELPAKMGSRLITAVGLKRQGVDGDELVEAINKKHGTRQIGGMDDPGDQVPGPAAAR